MHKIEIIYDILGMMGTMLSGSKSHYDSMYPDHQVFFNACVFDSEFNQIWYGDVDLTLESEKFQDLAGQLNETIYVTREQPYRFDGLTKNQINGNPDVITFKALFPVGDVVPA